MLLQEETIQTWMNEDGKNRFAMGISEFLLLGRIVTPIDLKLVSKNISFCVAIVFDVYSI